jgi:hypothetical protein
MERRLPAPAGDQPLLQRRRCRGPLPVLRGERKIGFASTQRPPPEEPEFMEPFPSWRSSPAVVTPCCGLGFFPSSEILSIQLSGRYRSEFPKKPSAKFLTPFIPPNPRAKGPVSAWPSASEFWNPTGVASRCKAKRGAGRPSRFYCLFLLLLAAESAESAEMK